MNVGKGLTNGIIALNIVSSAILALMSIPAFITGLEYVTEGDVTFGFNIFPCCLSVLAGTLVVLVMSIISVVLTAQIASRIMTPWSYRALYIFLLYPMVHLGFVLANTWNVFITTYIFGFPLFASGMVLLPFAAIALQRTTMRSLESYKVPIRCPFCHETAQIPRFNESIVCQKCHHMFGNPAANLPQPEAEAQEERVPMPRTANKRGNLK